MTGPQGMGPLCPIKEIPFVANASFVFAYSGGYQTWVVPAGVTLAEFELHGAQGKDVASGTNNLGGRGGILISRHTVIPGETLRVYNGQSGQRDGAFNGGAASAGTSSTSGGGGGGATDVRRSPYALADRLAVAGGGGGAGAGYPNGQPNAPGGDGAGNGTGDAGANGAGGGGMTGGGGGQIASGGTAGQSGGTWGGTPAAGTLGDGGVSGIYQGGGGGGGLYGGGGGPGNVAPGGGGGGSGGLPGLGTVIQALKGVRSGDGLAIVRWMGLVLNYSDNFNRSNNSSMGTDWIDSIQYEIFGNRLICPGSTQTAMWNNAMVSNDYIVQMTIAVKDIHASSKQEIILRGQNTSNSGKYYRVGPAGSGIIIERYNGASLSTVATAAVSFADGDILKASCIGNVITGYKNGTQVIQYTDTALDIWNGLYPGIYTDSPFGWAAYEDWSIVNP